ncbi:MAG: M57 family metalloprotease [Myxococcota bacterium]
MGAPASEAELEEIVENLLGAGYSMHDMAVVGERVVVQGDIVMGLEASRALDGPRFRHYRAENLVRLSDDATICIVTWQIATGFPKLRATLDTALLRWNALSLRYRFVATDTPTPQRCDAEILVELEEFTDEAYATWPDANGLPGPVIVIGTRNEDFDADNEALREFTVATYMHEIGHAMGLRHTDWKERSEARCPIGAHHIPGTPTEGTAPSVMNSQISETHPTSHWTEDDRTAIAELYGRG